MNRGINLSFIALLVILFIDDFPLNGETSMQIQPGKSGSPVSIHAPGSNNQACLIFASTNLINWKEIARLFDRSSSTSRGKTNHFYDFASTNMPQRFYYCLTPSLSDDYDWKNRIQFPNEDFFSSTTRYTDKPQWIKFAILKSDPYRVYYQDSTKYAFHYDFAVNRLPEFKGLNREIFNQKSLHRDTQQVVLGAVLFPPAPVSITTPYVQEYGIQFVGLDAYPQEQLCNLFELVKSTIETPPGVLPVYMPSYEQTASAMQYQDYLATRGITIGTLERWQSNNSIYSDGWAIGRLKYVTAAEIKAQYAKETLCPEDILLTDMAPSELPFLAGILTQQPTTPNSHPVILARSYGIPFAYLATEDNRKQADALAGKEVLYQTCGSGSFQTLLLVDLESHVEPAIRDELRNRKKIPMANIRPKATYGAISASVGNLTPSDIVYFGGKAANFGLLRRAIPNSSPPAIAFSFDLWDDFMDQTLPNGRSLRSEIHNRLSGSTYPPNMTTLTSDLDAIRKLITKTATFSAQSRQAITNALKNFDPLKNIRFRSSSNAEDSAVFSAAGLYDSYSGCLADDLDSDDLGPSYGDPTEPNECGVFRAIQKVYASFYNDNAFLERLRHGISEETTGMALLVHYSAPDIEEMANGVAVVKIPIGYPTKLSLIMVTQTGAVSVTNPEAQTRPEQVEVTMQLPKYVGQPPQDVQIKLKETSALLPLGGSVLEWDTEYRTLAGLMASTYIAYAQYSPGKQHVLDFEYKKKKPGNLEIKQVREIGQTSSTNQDCFLINEPVRYCVLQAEDSDVFANHRLKSLWSLETRSMALTTNNLSSAFYTSMNLEYVEGGVIRNVSSKIGDLPNASYGVTNIWNSTCITNEWILGSGANQWACSLFTVIPPESTNMLFITHRNLRKTFSVNFSTPVPTFGWNGTTYLTTQHTVRLFPFAEFKEITNQQPVVLIATNRAGAKTSRFEILHYAPLPGTLLSGATVRADPISPIARTTIQGIIDEPILLKHYYAQSAAQGHHGFAQYYVFEPGLDPDLTEFQHKKLQQADVQLIYVSVTWSDYDKNTVSVGVLGSDGKFRAW